MNENRKLFRKEFSKANGGKLESCSVIKDINRKLTRGDDEVRRI